MQNYICYDEIISNIVDVQTGQLFSHVAEFIFEKKISIEELKKACINKEKNPSNYKIEIPSFREKMLREISYERHEEEINNAAIGFEIKNPDANISLIVSSDHINKCTDGIIYISHKNYDWCGRGCEIYITLIHENIICIGLYTPFYLLYELNDNDVNITDLGCICD
jgi:hypothetical protein